MARQSARKNTGSGPRVASPGEGQAGQRREPESASHAREIPTGLSVEGRVAYIADLMERLEWVRGKTGKQLAAAWGLAQATVDAHACEASRRVTADATEIRREITVRGLQRLASAEDDKSFAALGKLLADVSGANAPQRAEVLSTSATPAEAARLVREMFGGQGAKPEAEGADEVPPSSPGG
jgi:hypothetical protein